MKFTEFIKDYVKKHPGVKYKDAIKDKKVRCLWHDHRGKEIGCPSTCPPVPQERAQFTTLPRPASIDTPQPLRQYTPQARQPPILGRTRNDPPQQQQVHVTADNFPINQLATAISNRSRTRAPQGQSFLSGLINTVGENLANALHGIHEAIPRDRPILGPTPTPTTPDGNRQRDNDFFFSYQDYRPSHIDMIEFDNRPSNVDMIEFDNIPIENIYAEEPVIEDVITENISPVRQRIQRIENKTKEDGKKFMTAFLELERERLAEGSSPAVRERELNVLLNMAINEIAEKDRADFVAGLNAGSDKGKTYRVLRDGDKYRFTRGAGLKSKKKKSRKYI